MVLLFGRISLDLRFTTYLMDSMYSNLFIILLSFILILFHFIFIYKGFSLPSLLSPLRYITFFPISNLLILESTILTDQPQMKNNNEFQGVLIDRCLLSLLLSKLRYILVLFLRLLDRITFAVLQSPGLFQMTNVKSFQVKLDGHFKHDGIHVQVVDGYIVTFVIHTRKHDLKTNGNCFTVYECTGRYMLPESIEVEIIKNSWHKAILVVEATEAVPNNKCTAPVNGNLKFLA